MIEELQRFINVANNGNLTKTAEKLFITQSALTQSIQRLEKQIGAKLFIHKGKSLQLTTDGKAVAEIGTKIIELWKKAKNPHARQITIPTYTIGTFDNAALKLGTYFQNVSATDKYRLELVIGTSHTLLSQLQLGTIDIAICVVDKKNPPPPNITLVETFQEELIPVSSKRFKQRLSEIPFILYNKESFTRQYIDDLFTKKGITPKIFAESTSVTFMKELAILGCGIALLPQNLVMGEIKQKTLKKQNIKFTLKREYGLYISKQGNFTKNDAVVKEIIERMH